VVKVKSAKELLLDYDILKDGDTQAPRHEFQSYAYRLAYDLNDLENLKIYMRLAKNIERTLLEQAYAYAIDTDTKNKAKIFFWKVKDLRTKLSHQKIVNSFDYSNVIKQMTTLRNELADEIIKKNTKRFLNEEISVVKSLLLDFFKEQEKKKVNILVVGLDNLALLDLITYEKVRLFGIDWARNLTKLTKKHFDDIKISPRPRFITKDFLKNSYKLKYFDLVIVNSVWSFIPLDYEKKFLNALFDISCDKVLIGVLHSSKTGQAWDTFDAIQKKYFYFQKSVSTNDFRELIVSLRYNIKKRSKLINNKIYYLLDQKK
jgi:hypothetical protein